MPLSWGRKFRFKEIKGLDQEIDRLYWIMRKLYTDKKAVSEIGETGKQLKKLDQVTTGNVQLQSLQVGEGKDCRAIERIESFSVAFPDTTISGSGKQQLSLSDVNYPQLVKIRRGTLWSVYLDVGSGPLEDVIVTSRVVHSSSADDNGTLKVELYNTTTSAIVLGAGNAYLTLLTPRKF